MFDSETKTALRLLRAGALGQGYDWDDVSDAELLEGLQQLAEHYRRSGRAADLLTIGYEKLGDRFERLLAINLTTVAVT